MSTVERLIEWVNSVDTAFLDAHPEMHQRATEDISEALAIGDLMVAKARPYIGRLNSAFQHAPTLRAVVKAAVEVAGATWANAGPIMVERAKRLFESQEEIRRAMVPIVLSKLPALALAMRSKG